MATAQATISPQYVPSVNRRGSNFGALPLAQASKIWLEEQSRYWKPRTQKSYRVYVNRLLRSFPASMTLEDFTILHFRDYQQKHQADIRAESINHDLATLGNLLEKAGLWEPIKAEYRPLPIPAWTPPRVLTEKEERAFFQFAASDPDFSLAYWIATLTNSTSASGCEIRGLKLRHIDISSSQPVMYVPSEAAKNEHRARVIPLNASALKAMTNLVERACKLGATQPEHYLFPFRPVRNHYDPTRHVSDGFIYKHWNRLIDAAIKLGIIKFRLRPHDLRHQIITKMLENGTPEETVRSIAGHVSEHMMRHYSHTRLDAKAKALNSLNMGGVA